MAEQAAAGLNYGLSGNILDRVARAGATQAPKTSLGEAIAGVGETIVTEVTEAKEKWDIAIAGWDIGFDMQGDRGDWASPELYDQFQEIEAFYKEQYLQAVKSGDKQGMARLLKDQGNRSSSVKGWQDTMATAKKINDGVGWGVNLADEDKYVLGILAKNDGEAKMRIGEKGEMVFDMQVPVLDANGEPTGETKTRTVTRREIDEMVAKGTNPLELELKVMELNEAFTKGGLNGDMFDLNKEIRRNRLSIDNDKLPALMNQSFGGASFRDHIKSHPDFKAAYVDGGFMSSVDPTPDGELTSADMAGFSESDMDNIINEMEKNPETAKDYVADWMGRINQQNWQKGVDEKNKLEEEERRENWRDTRTTYEKNLDRAEQDRLEKIEARKRPLAVGSNAWGNIAVEKYFKDDDGDWAWEDFSSSRDEFGNLFPPVVRKIKDHTTIDDDYDVIVAEIERLQLKTSSNPNETSSTPEFG